MRTWAHRLFILWLALTLALPARCEIVATVAQSDQPVAPTDRSDDELQPKFFLFGFLINVLLKFAVSSFQEWRQQSLTHNVADPINYRRLLRNSALSSLASSAGSAFFPLPTFSFKSAVATPVDGGPETVAPAPRNFQGVHVAVVGFDATGAVSGLRSLQDTYRTGERIKLKVVSTFDAWLVVERLGAQEAREQVYPRDARQAVLLRAGHEVLVPLVEDQYLQFVGQPGHEQLVLTFRDPGVVSGTASQSSVLVQQDADGVGLLQEVAPGTQAVISHTLGLQHAQP